MEVPELVIRIGGEEFTLREFNCWVCIFTDAPAYDHLYVSHPKVFAVFECRKLLDQMMHLGFRMQIAPHPCPWDLEAYDRYIANQATQLDRELFELEDEAREVRDED